MEGLIMAGQLLLGLSFLVGVHEAGHLLAAKAFGMRVEKFSIGFPPKIWGFQYGETEYSFGAIPLGGFVKITGMIDESLDTSSLSEEPQTWEFRSKPAWQRLIVMMGGIVVNVISGIIIFVSMTYMNGENYLTKDELNKNGILAYELGQEMGFKTGDKIINVNGKDFDQYSDVVNIDVILGDESYYTVQRGEEVLELTIPSDFLDKFADKKKYNGQFISMIKPFEVGEVTPGSGADQGGLKTGDQFLSINNQEIADFGLFREALEVNKDKQIQAVVRRTTGQIDSLNFQVSEEGTLGFYPVILLNFAHRDYSFGDAVGKGTLQAFSVVWTQAQAFGKIFSGQISASKSLSGPIGIAKMFGGTWDWQQFWGLVGLLSMILAFVNFLPIPALDGGHVAFLTYEIVSGRKPSDKFLENSQKVGMVLLLCIMGFAIFNDIFKELF